MTAHYDWQARKTLAECNRHMLTNEIAFDVYFLVGEKRQVVGAHRYVLVSRSCVFYAMLIGPMAAKTDEKIAIPDIECDIFQHMLEYIYCEDTKVEAKNAIQILYSARKYGITGLEEKCRRVLEHGLNTHNVCDILQEAHKFDESTLKKKCLEYIWHQPKEILRSGSFGNLHASLVKEIIKSEKLDAKEEVVFDAALRWSEQECLRNGVIVSPQNQRHYLGGILYYIRVPVLEASYYHKTVVKSDILSAEERKILQNYFSGTNTDVKKFRTDKRSKGENQTLHWRFGPVNCMHNETTAIAFSSSREVFIDGVEIDGTGYDEEHYDVFLNIYDMDNQEKAKCKDKLVINKKQQSYQIKFPAPPIVSKGFTYTVILKIQAEHRYYGASGRSNLNKTDSQPAYINPEGEFTKLVVKKDQVPAILVRPFLDIS
ncbi:BTB/POZ domain-containing protein 6-like [Saccostrea echinata]|uniref:BTB/POZ domain-containing protein 6-like n=1 Tax=Saccostrea echinata TaxID=191078 RepID=UPI002A816152|nr:BTB/POZ domain-containing protein 6-like [Saccostrea echinata]